MPVSKDGRAALGYWGVVQRAVRERATTSELWAAIRDTATAQGLERPGVSLRGINELRSFAAQSRNADDRLANAARDTSFGAQHIADAPWARDYDERNANPMIQIRFLHQTIEDGEYKEDWRTIVHSGRIPQGVEDLYDLIAQSAEQMADNYEVENVGYAEVSVLSV